MIRVIAFLLISNVLCAQHPYIELESTQLETKAVDDGYRVMNTGIVTGKPTD